MRKTENGFTLIELMVTLALASVLLSMAVPSFTSMLAVSNIRSLSSELAAHSYLARSEAIKLNQASVLCASASGTECEDVDWDQGWVVISGGTVVEHHPALPGGYAITASGGLKQVTYQPTGFGATGASFTVCGESDASAEQRVVTIASSGKAQIHKTSSGSCVS